MHKMIREKFDLTGRVAIITGASKGIGEAMARGLAEFGATVVVSSRKQEAVDSVATQFQQEGLSAACLLYTSPSPRDQRGSRMPSSA